MSFLRNAWYCVGFGEQLGDGDIQSITALNEALVLFRDDNGNFVALTDRCPHRFARLSGGQLIGGALQCPYHGLRFNGDGRCVLNPHGNGKIPATATVRRYPTLERYGGLWVWMGEREADPALLPDFSMITERPGWTRIVDRLLVRANYQLVIDNLLDLTHVQFLHPFLGASEPPPPQFTSNVSLTQNEATVTAINELNYSPTSPLFRLLWERGETPRYCQMRGNMRWHPPALLYLDTGATYVDQPRAAGPSIELCHWLTPETATTTHYFWTATRDRYVGDANMSEQIRRGIDGAFRGEDEPMIESIQAQMGTHDLFDLHPVMLTTDGPAVRARRLLAQLIERESRA